MPIDETKLDEFLGRFVADLGAAAAAGNVVIGHRLGLYQALARGPASATELGERTDCHPRYLAEWLRGQAAGGYITYDPTTEQFGMTDEQAFALSDPEGPVYVPGAFVLTLAALRAEAAITEAFRTGNGFGWHEHDSEVFDGTEMFFRPGYLANLTTNWIPALDGVEAILTAGGTVADIGCGFGASSVLLAGAYPRARIVGSDYHEKSIELARKRAAQAGVSDRVAFEVAPAQSFGGRDYDLVTSFDCLHDMGDPVGAGRHVRDSLAPHGTWMIVEPAAGDRIEDNLNPLGRAFYSFSTFLCVPNSLSQPGGYALGAQAGEAAIRQVVTDAGFTRFRRAAQTPFNLVYEAKP